MIADRVVDPRCLPTLAGGTWHLAGCRCRPKPPTPADQAVRQAYQRYFTRGH